jgi:hypothetical protein
MLRVLLAPAPTVARAGAPNDFMDFHINPYDRDAHNEE